MRRRRIAAFVFDNSLLLPLGAAIALVWANRAPVSYQAFAHASHFVVNDVGMTLFFALATKEIVEATAPRGALHPPRRAIMPVAAAIGGMLVPAGLFLTLVHAAGAPELARGWAIPSATDIAFSFLVARMVFGSGHPAIPFLLLLAIADDALGLLILAAFYPTGTVRPLAFLVLMSTALIGCWMLRRGRVTNAWPYVVVGGLLSWLALARGGLHPALALVPVIPFVPHAARDHGLFEESATPVHDALTRFEHQIRVPVQAVLLFFGLSNAGVSLASVGIGTWIVLVALVVGKPLGIAGIAALAARVGARLPAGVTWRDVIVLGAIAGIGFTVALFFCTAAFDEGAYLDQTKIGALLSFAAVPVSVFAAFGLRVGRFART